MVLAYSVIEGMRAERRRRGGDNWGGQIRVLTAFSNVEAGWSGVASVTATIVADGYSMLYWTYAHTEKEIRNYKISHHGSNTTGHI